jgi:hypothetical protein
MAHTESDPIVIGRKVYVITVVSAIAFALAAYVIVN